MSQNAAARPPMFRTLIASKPAREGKAAAGATAFSLVAHASGSS